LEAWKIKEARSTYEPPVDKSVDYRAFPLQTTTEEIIEIFAQLKKLFN
jgi:hypothetical protein